MEATMGDTVITVLLGLLIAAGVLAIVYLVLVLRKVITVLGSVDETLKESSATISALRESVVPVISEAEGAVKAVNLEMSRIDGIVGNLEEISDKITVTADRVNTIVNKPMDAANSIGVRFKRIRRERAMQRAEMPRVLPPQE